MAYPVEILSLHHTIISKSSHRIMNKGLVVGAFIIMLLSCTKETPQTDNKGQDIPASEFQALKKEVNDLKTAVESLTGNQEQSVSKSEFDALKQENEALKAQVELLTSGFFEVDGLRFDKNGTLISVPKLESEIVEDAGLLMGSAILLTTTRTYDADGRVIEIDRNYNTHSEWASIPYYWQKVFYEYSGKTCKTTTQTCQRGMAAGVPYIEEITEVTYW